MSWALVLTWVQDKNVEVLGWEESRLSRYNIHTEGVLLYTKSFAKDLLYVPSRQHIPQTLLHQLWRNNSMGPPSGINLTTHNSINDKFRHFTNQKTTTTDDQPPTKPLICKGCGCGLWNSGSYLCAMVTRYGWQLATNPSSVRQDLAEYQNISFSRSRPASQLSSALVSTGFLPYCKIPFWVWASLPVRLLACTHF